MSMNQKTWAMWVSVAGFLLLVVSVGLVQAQRARDRGTAGGTGQIAGTWTGTYQSNQVPPTNVTLIFQEFGTTVTGTYLSANGAQGVMYGTSQPSGEANLSVEQKTPACTGLFKMPATRNGNTLQWKFKGVDCKGTEDGAGTATLQPAAAGNPE